MSKKKFLSLGEKYHMKFYMKKLGIIEQAKLSLGDLTIVCGNNNTGKTYATYALYGFLHYWKRFLKLDIEKEKIDTLLKEGAIKLDIKDYVKDISSISRKASLVFSNHLMHKVFASSEKYFSNSEFGVEIKPDDIDLSSGYDRKMGTTETEVLSISKEEKSSVVTISLLSERNKVKVYDDYIDYIIKSSLAEILFENYFPRPFIASTERTGAAIFRKELDLYKNRLVDRLGDSKKGNINPIDIFNIIDVADYALPVKKNVDFMRDLEKVSKRESFIAKEHGDILGDFADIIGGKYSVSKNDGLRFVPKGSARVKLTMDESSSAVRSLLDIGFYLRHVAEKDDLLMVDEPELNLHPDNQRKVARLFARLVNIGLKVYITTHSDYIVRELSTLIMLNSDRASLRKIAEGEGYKKSELIDHNKVKVYIAKKKLLKLENGKNKTCHTLVEANVDSEYGIEADSFDDTIKYMNRIQEEIIFAEEDEEEDSSA